MVYLLYGKEWTIIKKETQKLINSFNIQNIIYYDAEEVNFSDIMDELNFNDLFNEQKVIVVSNFSIKKVNKDDEKKLSFFIENESSNILILKSNDDSLDSKRNIVKLLNQKSKVTYFEKLNYRTLENYVTNLFKEEKYKIDYNTIKKLLKCVEYNSDIAFNEIDKLLLYKIKDKKITEEDIDTVVSKNLEKEMFTLGDAFINRKVGDLFDSYKNILSMKVDLFYVLDYLSRQVRQTYQIKVLSESMNEVEIASTLSLNPYVVKLGIEKSRNIKDEDLFRMMDNIYHCEELIKIESYDINKVIDNLFINI